MDSGPTVVLGSLRRSAENAATDDRSAKCQETARGRKAHLASDRLFVGAAASKVIIFPLMPHHQHRHGLVVVDLEQRDVPAAPNGIPSSRRNGLSAVAFRHANGDDSGTWMLVLIASSARSARGQSVSFRVRMNSYSRTRSACASWVKRTRYFTRATALWTSTSR